MTSSQDHSFRVRDTYLNALCVEILSHGIYTTIASVALYILATRFKKQVSHVLMTLLILAMYSLATTHVGVRWYWIRHAFIVYGSTADSESAVAALGDPRFLWLWMTSGIAASLNILIADCTLIWRCWSIWGRSWLIVAAPITCTITGISFFIYQEQPQPSTQWSSWGSSINWGVPYFAMSLATTLLCTSLIVFRLWRFQPYRRAVEIIVESAALYAASLVVFLAFFVRDDLDTAYPQAILYSITGIAPTLIVVRVVCNPREYDGTIPSTSLRFETFESAVGEEEGEVMRQTGSRGFSVDRGTPTDKSAGVSSAASAV